MQLSRPSHPNDLALGLLTLLAGFGQGFAGGRIQRQQNLQEQKDKEEARRQREKDREYQMRKDLSMAGERTIERSMQQEQNTLQAERENKRIGLEQQQVDIARASAGRQFIKDMEDSIYKTKNLEEDKRYHNLWASIENAKLALEKSKIDATGTGAGSGSKGKNKGPLTREEFAIGILQDAFKDPVNASILRDVKKRDTFFNAINAAWDAYMTQAPSTPPEGSPTSVLGQSGQGVSASSDPEDRRAGKGVGFNPNMNMQFDPRYEVPANRSLAVPQMNALPGPPPPDYSNISAALPADVAIPFEADTSGFRGDIGGAPIPSIQAASYPVPSNVPNLNAYNPVSVEDVLHGLLAGYKRKFVRPISFEPMRTVK